VLTMACYYRMLGFKHTGGSLSVGGTRQGSILLLDPWETFIMQKMAEHRPAVSCTQAVYMHHKTPVQTRQH
jgi:hypothetical protein